MKKILSILLNTLIATGCTAFGGDMIIRVSGSVPISGAAERMDEPCQLGMVSAETGKQGTTRDITADLSTTMMVVAGPEPKPYYWLSRVSCGISLVQQPPEPAMECAADA